MDYLSEQELLKCAKVIEEAFESLTSFNMPTPQKRGPKVHTTIFFLFLNPHRIFHVLLVFANSRYFQFSIFFFLVMEASIGLSISRDFCFFPRAFFFFFCEHGMECFYFP